MQPIISRISPSSDSSGNIEQSTHLRCCSGIESSASQLGLCQVLFNCNSKDLIPLSTDLGAKFADLTGMFLSQQVLRNKPVQLQYTLHL